ncbi:DUF397 domain-containing protein [Streptomyces sp. NPDC052236]|uniref:DUF397 domain-containing protein n=1 Tax=Streptomyces sp. NPDC052236 TaxID=3365686 RepID=UPI0037D8A830
MNHLTRPPFDPAELSWSKATASSEQGACVEVARVLESWLAVRDSKDISRPGLVVPTGAFTALVNAVRAHEL